MKVRMTKLSAGPRGVRPIGAEVSVSDAEGLALIAARAAVQLHEEPEPTRSTPDVETATAEPAREEAAFADPPRRRRKATE